MRKLLLVFCTIVCFQNLLAQGNKIIIEGIFKGFEENTLVKLRDTENNVWMDSVNINNEKFVLKTKQKKYNYPSQYFIYVGNNEEVIPVLLENGEKLKIELNKSDFPKHIVLSSKNQETYERLDSIFYIPYTEIVKNTFLINSLKKQNATQFKGNIIQLENIIIEERNKINNSLKKYPGSFVALHYISNYINVLQPDRVILADFLNTLDKKYKLSKYAKAIQYYINNDTIILNDELFDFHNNSKNISNEYKKDFILLDIASNYCYYSKKAKPILEKVVKKYANQLDVFSIHVDNDLKGLQEYAINKYENWNFYYHPEGRFSNFFIKYQIVGTPSYYLFDKKGNLISHWENDVDLEEQISTYIK